MGQGNSLLLRFPMLGVWRDSHTGDLCRSHLLNSYSFRLTILFAKKKNLLRFVGSMANQRSTIHSMFPAACKIMEVYFPLTARE